MWYSKALSSRFTSQSHLPEECLTAPGPASLAKGPARGQDAATVAGAFKQLLRLAPECVFTNAAYAEFVRAATDAGKLRALIAALPAANQVCAPAGLPNQNNLLQKIFSRFHQSISDFSYFSQPFS